MTRNKRKNPDKARCHYCGWRNPVRQVLGHWICAKCAHRINSATGGVLANVIASKDEIKKE